MVSSHASGEMFFLTQLRKGYGTGVAGPVQHTVIVGYRDHSPK